MNDPKLVNVAPERDTAPQEQPTKKTYEKPQVIYRAPLEAMAGLCPELGGGKEFGTCSNPTS
jgi:hypothetical protein